MLVLVDISSNVLELSYEFWSKHNTFKLWLIWLAIGKVEFVIFEIISPIHWPYHCDIIYWQWTRTIACIKNFISMRMKNRTDSVVLPCVIIIDNKYIVWLLSTVLWGKICSKCRSVHKLTVMSPRKDTYRGIPQSGKFPKFILGRSWNRELQDFKIHLFWTIG